MFVSSFLIADETVTHELIIGVRPSNELSINGSTAYLVIDRNDPEADQNYITDDRLTYSVSTNQSGKKIVAYLLQSLEGESVLTVDLDVPSHASPMGPVELSTAPMDLVRGISQQMATNLRMKYVFYAPNSVTGEDFPPQNRTIVYMMIDM